MYLPVSQTRESAEEITHWGVYAVFRTLPAATTQKILNQMDRRDRIIFMLLDGRRTVRDVAHLIHRSELDVARGLVRLLNQGYIAYSGNYGF